MNAKTDLKKLDKNSGSDVCLLSDGEWTVVGRNQNGYYFIEISKIPEEHKNDLTWFQFNLKDAIHGYGVVVRYNSYNHEYWMGQTSSEYPYVPLSYKSSDIGLFVALLKEQIPKNVLDYFFEVVEAVEKKVEK